MPDLDRLLARIGLDAAPSADLGGLRSLHRAYLTAMPYETLAIHLGEYAPLDLDALEDRVCAGGRGGYCFELNGLLAWMLEQLGFTVQRREACVGPRDEAAPTNHLMLVVDLGPDGAWLADAGLGEGWLDPLELRPGVVAGPGRLGWTVERLPAGWWVGHHPWGGFPGLTITEPTVALDAFAPHHERLSCDPASPFVAALVVQQPHDDRIVSLRARTVTAKGPALDERRVIADADDFAATLQSFRIDPSVLGAERTDRLWQAAREQHETWQATRVL